MIWSTQLCALITLAYIAGVCFYEYAMLSTFFTFLLLCACTFQQEKHIHILLLIISFLFGSFRYHQVKDSFTQDQNFLAKSINMQVTVLDINHESTTRKDTCITMRVMSIEDQNMTRLLSKNIYIYVPYYAKLWIKQGQVIFMRDVILQQPKSHSFQKYLIKEGIWALAHLKKLRYTTIRKPHPLVQYYGELKSNILTSMHEKISPKTYALYASIFCGKKLKTDESLQAKKLFQYWGISHYLARSGLHVMILIWLLFFMFSYIPCALAYKQLTIALILTLYYLATYSSIAFLRAFLMYILYMLCQILHLPVKTLHVFCTTTLLIVLYNPYQIFFLDFQLSFSITLLILWFLEQLQKRKTIAS